LIILVIYVTHVNATEHRRKRVTKRVPEPEGIFDRSLAEYYSRLAKKYMRIPCKRVLYKIKAKGIVEGRGLDVGTGPGIFPISIVKAYPRIRFVGIDLSPTMVAVARENAREFGLERLIDFRVGSAYQLPCPDKSMDLVTCINTLHHLGDPVAFFSEVDRVLKKGGHFVIVDFHRDTSRVALWFLNLLWKWFITRNGLGTDSFMESVRSSYTVSECRAFLERASLRRWTVYTRSLEMWIESR
jgi:ubiquinone/menaquinone biosynthesis C-methylase UbiE